MHHRLRLVVSTLAPAVVLSLLTAACPARAADATWSIIPSPNVGIGFNILNGVAAVSPSDAWAVGTVGAPHINTFPRELPLLEHWDGTTWSEVPRAIASGALNGVVAASATDAWAVGTSPAGTLIEHWNGTNWSVVPSPSLGTNLFYDTLNDVAALSATDAWAVGTYVYGPLIEHWNGATWSVIPSPTPAPGAVLNAVTALSPTDVWAVGSIDNASDLLLTQTLIEHWDGTRWSVVPSPYPDTNSYDTNALNGVTAVAANDIWAVGYARKDNSPSTALTEHWNGTAWSIVPSPSPSTTGDDRLQGVAAVSATNVWAVGRYDSSGLNEEQTLIEHWNGTAWSIVPSPTPGVGADPTILNGVVALASGDIWAVGSSTMGTGSSASVQTLSEHWNGASWSAIPSPNPGTEDNELNAVAVISTTDAWAVGQQTLDEGKEGYTVIEHWNGAGWNIVPSPNPGAYFNQPLSVAAVSTNDVWAVGYYALVYQPVTQTLVMHWDGTRWSVIRSPSPHAQDNILQGVTAVSSNNVWAVGYYNNGLVVQTLIEHWDGTSWSVIPSPNVSPTDDRLSSVTAVSATDIWAVGHSCHGCGWPQPLIEHWDGTAWSVVAQPMLRGDLQGVVAVAANDIWAVGTGPTGTLTEHWDGSAWRVVPSPSPEGTGTLTSVAFRSASDVWAVGSYSYLINSTLLQERLIEHWDGSRWSVSPSPNPGAGGNDLSGVATDRGSGDVWAVGSYLGPTANRTLVELRG